LTKLAGLLHDKKTREGGLKMTTIRGNKPVQNPVQAAKAAYKVVKGFVGDVARALDLVKTGDWQGKFNAIVELGTPKKTLASQRYASKTPVEGKKTKGLTARAELLAGMVCKTGFGEFECTLLADSLKEAARYS